MNRLTNLLLRYRHWAALASGGLSALGVEPWGLWPLTLLCLALLIWLTGNASTKKQAFLAGWLFGISHFTISLQWIGVSFTYQGAMPAWLGYVSVFLLSLYLAVYPALAALGAWWAGRLGGRGSVSSIPFILAFAGFWIIAEWLRSWMFTGFAWNPLSIILVPANLTGLTKFVGSYGLSGIVIVIAGFAAQFNVIRKNRMALVCALGLLTMTALLSLFLHRHGGRHASGQGHRVTIVQPGVTQEERNDPLMANSNVGKLVKHSIAPPEQSSPRILLWPESALPWYLEGGYPFRFYQGQPGESAQGTRLAVSQLLGPDDILITGNDRLVIDSDGQLTGAHNSVAAIDARGDILGQYDKAHLVPYGEYLALRWLLEPLGAARLVPGVIDFWPGPGARTLSLGEGKPNVGIQICYEIIFSGRVTDSANRPDFIYNPSNDAWFGTIGPPQHLAQARLRAVEEGLPVVRATPTGISAVIDADGNVVHSLPLGVAGQIDAKLPAARTPTLFARHGNALPVGLAILMLLFAFLPVVTRRASR